jgi:hypothetical protein
MDLQRHATAQQAPDFQQSFAAGAAAAAAAKSIGLNAAFTNAVVAPGNISPGAGASIAALAVTPKASGRYLLSANLIATAAGADTGLAAVLEMISGAGVTVIGGISTGTTGGLVFETAGHLITFGASPTIAVLSEANAAVGGAGATSRSVSALVQAPLGAQSALVLTLGSTGAIAYTNLILSMWAVELP